MMQCFLLPTTRPQLATRRQIAICEVVGWRNVLAFAAEVTTPSLVVQLSTVQRAERAELLSSFSDDVPINPYRRRFTRWVAHIKGNF